MLLQLLVHNYGRSIYKLDLATNDNVEITLIASTDSRIDCELLICSLRLHVTYCVKGPNVLSIIFMIIIDEY